MAPQPRIPYPGWQLRLLLLLAALGLAPGRSAAWAKDGVADRLDNLDSYAAFWHEVPPPIPNALPRHEVEVPGKPDSTLLKAPPLAVEYKLAELNQQSIIPMRYHRLVKKYIDLFTTSRRGQMERTMGLADLYFPLFRAALDRHRLPQELVYLAVVESALNPLAVSVSGATGLWQFKMNTIPMLNLRVDSFMDDRMDPRLSTEAACVYLKYLHSMFDDWLLALAAYNIGPGAVKRAILRAEGERDFWKLLPVLPEAAQNYIPAFIAANYVFTYAGKLGMRPRPPRISFAETDTVHVSHALSFKPLARWTGVSVELLYFLNPRFRAGYVPKPKAGEHHVLTLPTKASLAFAERCDRIYAQSHKAQETPFPQRETRSIRHRHRVQKGEYLHKIAIRYVCTLDDIYEWNGKVQIHPGDELTIWLTPKQYARMSNDTEQ
ncbi:MAG: lytic transglycosylase [Bacteroidia bacterium]|nr:MAG: lytic transglycosylase [Bacteroidia bacterium]